MQALNLTLPTWMAPAGHLLHRFGPMVLAVALFQGVFWFGILPFGKVGPMPPGAIIRTAEVAVLETPTYAALEAAAFEPVTLTWTGCCDHRFYALRYLFTLDAPPAHDFALIDTVASDNVWIYVNGYVIRDHGRLAPRATYHGQDIILDRVSAGLLHEGENRVEIISARNALPYTDFHPFIFGEYKGVEKAAHARLFVVNDLAYASTLMAGFITVIALILLPQARNRLFVGGLTAIAGFFFLRATYYEWHEIPLPPVGVMIYYFVVTNALSVSWFIFIDIWTGYQTPRLWIAAVAGLALSLLIIAGSLMTDVSVGYDLAGRVTHIVGVTMGLGAVARFLWHLAHHQEERIWEAAAFSLCLGGLLTDVVYEVIWQINGGFTYKAAPFLLFALVAALVARNMRLYESMAAFNAMLNTRIAEGEQEIRLRYDQLQAEQKARALSEERQRILRDMHDGIGNHLVGLILQARAKKLDHESMLHGLEASLDDLRLVVDSLDQDEGSLQQALTIQHNRLARQAEAAGVSLKWTVTLDDTVVLAPRSVLQICRIVQEAVTNALRHAGARTISVDAVMIENPAGSVRLTIQDDGCGVPDPAPSGGKGLTNMRNRAQALGARLTIDGTKGGTQIVLVLPPSHETVS